MTFSKYYLLAGLFLSLSAHANEASFEKPTAAECKAAEKHFREMESEELELPTPVLEEGEVILKLSDGYVNRLKQEKAVEACEKIGKRLPTIKELIAKFHIQVYSEEEYQKLSQCENFRVEEPKDGSSPYVAKAVKGFYEVKTRDGDTPYTFYYKPYPTGALGLLKTEWFWTSSDAVELGAAGAANTHVNALYIMASSGRIQQGLKNGFNGDVNTTLASICVPK